MQILVDILHPAHVHFFRFIYEQMKHNHTFHFMARKKDVTLDLLDSFGLPYSMVSSAAKSPPLLGIELLKRIIAIDRIVRKDGVDCLMGISGISVAPVARLRKRPMFMFTDTEDTGLQGSIVYPLATHILTPQCFAKNLGPKHIRYNSYQELAYLHPNHFKPNLSILERDGIDLTEPFFFVRFTSFEASHDISQRGLNLDEKMSLINYLVKKARVVISSEGKLPRSLEKWRFQGRAADVHNYLYHAKLFFGDSQTMTTEAGLLGTPAIRCNSLAGTLHGLGNFRELENDYGLVYSFRHLDKAFTKLEELLSIPNLKEVWAEKRKRMLEEKDDVIEFVANYIETQTAKFNAKSN